MKKIGIIGTRRRDTPEAYTQVEQKLLENYVEGDWIVSGGCPKGGDRFAEVIAKKFGIPILIFYPNWDKYKKGAGFVRNLDIAKASDSLIACVSRDRTGGTEDTIKKYMQQEKEHFLILVTQEVKK